MTGRSPQLQATARPCWSNGPSRSRSGLPALPAPGCLSPTKPRAGTAVVQWRGQILWFARRPPADRRPGAGSARRQSHGPTVYGRLCRRSAVCDVARVRVCLRQLRRAARRWARADRLHDHQCRALRSSAKQANAGGDHDLPPISWQPHRRRSPPGRRAGAWTHCPRQHVGGHGRSQVGVSLPARRPACHRLRAWPCSTATIARVTTPTPAG